MNGSVSSPRRVFKYDNLRAFLIFLVILAHCMEQFNKGRVFDLYRIIYSFHMPAFIWLTGNFARFDRRKILKHLVLPYFVFDSLYMLFAIFVLGKETEFQFTTPYWIMWYLLFMIFCYLLIPMLPEKGSGYALPLLACSVLVSLLAGFMNTLGYYMSLSRLFTFFPFFLGGYYREELSEKWRNIRIGRLPAAVLSLLVIAAGEFCLLHTDVPKAALYGSYSYANGEFTVLHRLVILLTAAAWILFLETVTPDCRIPFFSEAGKNTLSVFLLHGFVMRYAGKADVFHYTQRQNLLLACVLAAVLTAAFGNRLVGRVFRKLF